MTQKFSKWHHLGNDFMLLEAFSGSVDVDADLIRSLANRYTGIGFDQCIIAAPSTNDEVFAEITIYNSDGSRAANCLNGIGCITAWLVRSQLAPAGTNLALAVDDLHLACASAGESVTIEVPVESTTSTETLDLVLSDGTPIRGIRVEVGNPHFVVNADETDVDLNRLGTELNDHADFPSGVNVSCYRLVSSSHCHLRVWERGAGPTLACGSAATAVFLALAHAEIVSSSLLVDFELGGAWVEWSRRDAKTHLTLQVNPQCVYDGHYP